MDRKRSRFDVIAAGAVLALCCVLACSGCQSANAGIVTDADRAAVAADLAYVSIADRPTVWRPLDDVTPSPQPSPVPVTPSRSTPITLTGGAAKVEAFDVALAGNCADGSCAQYGDDDRPRRPIVRGVAATGRAVGAIGRGINRARPLRRIGGFLFRRCG